MPRKKSWNSSLSSKDNKAPLVQDWVVDHANLITERHQVIEITPPGDYKYYSLTCLASDGSKFRVGVRAGHPQYEMMPNAIEDSFENNTPLFIEITSKALLHFELSDDDSMTCQWERSKYGVKSSEVQANEEKD